MVESVDTMDLKSIGHRARAGATPVKATIFIIEPIYINKYINVLLWKKFTNSSNNIYYK